MIIHLFGNFTKLKNDLINFFEIYYLRLILYLETYFIRINDYLCFTVLYDKIDCGGAKNGKSI
ncbi:hypothetical protein X924_07925 [Petrotoga sp. 9PWA.NaAc.5.4]|nr:hypothetical protein X924_07925 [Petrotoga sp. 9PWA.NaAc.5.4]